MRDINGRDEIPERRVKRRYVDLGVRRQSSVRALKTDGQMMEFGQSGEFAGARFAVIFIHGRGGDRRLGMNDFSFGGNFNRLKNLSVKNGGVYLAPSVPDFGTNGLAGIFALVKLFKEASPGAPVVLACASMGSLICLGAAQDEDFAKKIAGMVFLGGAPDASLAGSEFVKKGAPIIFAHGSGDSVYDWRDQKAVFDAIRKPHPDYPTRFVLFETGTHGTPIRMVDWREILSRILSVY